MGGSGPALDIALLPTTYEDNTPRHCVRSNHLRTPVTPVPLFCGCWYAAGFYWTADDCCDPFWWSGYGRRLEGTFASLGANGLYIDQRPPQSRAQMRELRAAWAQAARVEAMRAARRAAEGSDIRGKYLK